MAISRSIWRFSWEAYNILLTSGIFSSVQCIRSNWVYTVYMLLSVSSSCITLLWYSMIFSPCTVSYAQELLHYFPIPQWTQPCCHPPPSHKELLQLQQWVSPGPKCWVLQDTMWAIRDRTLELPQWWLHSMRGLWEGPPLVSHWVVWNQEQPTGSGCGLQMGHQSVVGKWKWMWQLWKAVRSVLSTCVQRSFIHFMSIVELVCSLI